MQRRVFARRLVVVSTLLFVATGCASEGSGAPSPVDPGGQLAYLIDAGLMVRDVVTGADHKVDSPVAARRVDWSSDGSQLAIEGEGRIVLQDVGGPSTVVLPASEELLPTSVDLSPDGSAILFSGMGYQPGATPGVFVVDVDSGKVRTLVSGPDVWSPSWSPDGGSIAYAQLLPRGNRLTYGVKVMDLESGHSRQLTEASLTTNGAWTGSSWDVAWSPDGNWIAYVDGRSGDPRVELVHPDGTGGIPVGQGFQPAWSPDGNWIAYERFGSGSPSQDASGMFSGPPDQIWASRLDGSEARRLVGAGSSPAWGPAADSA